MVMLYDSEDEIEKVVRGFESCTTGRDEFSHRDHLAAAVWYLRLNPNRAADLMRASLHRFLDHHGCRQNYHETLTVFWIEIVSRALAGQPPGLSLLASTNAIVRLFGDSRLAFQYYSKEVVGSEKAKREWVEPNLKSLRSRNEQDLVESGS